MKKVFCFLALLVIVCGFSSALEMYIAPFYFIDEVDERVDTRNNYQKRLLNELGSVATGFDIRFKEVRANINPPQTVSDAIRVCRSEQAEYLLYGFISRKEYTIQGEIRLFDYEKRAVAEYFFSMDTIENELRLIKDFSKKIIEYVEKNYNIQIITEKPAEYSHFSALTRLGYWSPVDANWRDLIIGTFLLNGGIKFIPTDRAFVYKGFIFYASIGVDISYRLGVGNEYEAWDHSFTVYNPVNLHMKLNDRNELYAGIGYSYSIDLLNIKKPYENPSLEKYDGFGVFFDAGYQHKFKENIFLFADLRLELRLYQTYMLAVSPTVGVEFKLKTQEVTEK
jgi:hypothetical protein